MLRQSWRDTAHNSSTTRLRPEQRTSGTAAAPIGAMVSRIARLELTLLETVIVATVIGFVAAVVVTVPVR